MKDTATLSRRENEIAELFAWGASKKDVANRLHISTRTAENHARSIFEKTDVSKVNELSAWWFCTHFHISFDLSPLKRRILSITLVLILLPVEFIPGGAAILAQRNRNSESSVRAYRMEEEEPLLEL
jgi:DNA-binding CsgD family transcriptional regulator